MLNENREKKRYFAFLLALPALIIVALARLAPIVGGAMLAFKRFSAADGVLGSPWIGGDNFNKIFGNIAFRAILRNTLIININFIALTFILTLILGISLSYIKNTRLLTVFCILFSLPFFIPEIYWNVLFGKLFSSKGWLQSPGSDPVLYLTDGDVVRLLYIIAEAIRWAGLLASLAAFAARRAFERGRIAAVTKAAFSILLISVAFIPVTDFKLMHPLINPLVYEKVDNLTTFSFRTGLLNMDIGADSALWLMKSLYCFIVLALLLLFADRFILHSLLPSSGESIRDGQPGRTGENAAAVVISSVYAAFILLIIVLILLAVSGLLPQAVLPLFLHSGAVYLVLAVISSVIGILLSVLLAYPLTTAQAGVRKAYAVIFILLLAAGQFGIHDYLFIKSAGFLNTYSAIILSNMLNPAAVLILGAFCNYKSGDTPLAFGQFIKTCFPAIICIFIATLLLNMDSYTSSLMYMSRPDMQSPSVQVYQIYTGMNRVK